MFVFQSTKSPIPSSTFIQEAAIYIHEGEDNDKFVYHPVGKWSKLAYTILHNPIFYIIDLLVSILLMLLALIEKPAFFDQHGKENGAIVLVSQLLRFR